MKRRVRLVAILLVVVVAIVAGFLLTRPPSRITLTGMVTTDQVIVGSEIQGRLQHLLVREGDTVTNHQLVAVIQPQEQKADMEFFVKTEQQSEWQVAQAEADLRYQEIQTTNQIQQAIANFEAAQAQVTQAEADAENARLTADRQQNLFRQKVEPPQVYDQARTTYESAKARVEATRKQAQAAESAVALAKANAEQVTARRAALEMNMQQLAAAKAQKQKAKVRLDYTEIRAPIDGTIDVRAALQGEVVNPGQAIVTLINPDNLWVRVDVEETYIDRIRLGSKYPVILPSGAELEGTVFYRSAAGDYATQRDVSRTKRDIKTFEVRLRCDNHDRRLAVGMTAYVRVPLAKS